MEILIRLLKVIGVISLLVIGTSINVIYVFNDKFTLLSVSASFILLLLEIVIGVLLLGIIGVLYEYIITGEI